MARLPGSPYDRTSGRKGGSEYTDQSLVRGQNRITTVGPHIAVVKNNADDMRRGSLSVWIEEFGGPEDDPVKWVTVRYASPFISHTPYKTAKNNDYDEIRHTAGMWVQSPDVGSLVLVTFPSGDKNQGVWFACLPDRFNTRMIPGLASTDTNWDALSDNNGPSKSPEFKNADGTYDQYQPVGEFHDPKRRDTKTYFDTPVDIEGQEKPINYHLARVFKEQGLNLDLIRGHTTSSAQRETPSDVFGISTKGRPVPDPKDNESLLGKLLNGISEELTKDELETLSAKKRRHGHSFVMDDGDLEGNNELIRLRTSSGHQLLMHDTKGVVYVGNAKGTVWMEFSNDGKLDVYAQDSINYRTANFNLHADQNININAGQNINIVSGAKFQTDAASINLKTTGGSIGLDSNRAFDIKSSGIVNIDAGGQVNIKGGSDVKIDGKCVSLGDGAGNADPVSALEKLSKADTIKDAAGFWKSTDKKISTVATRVPTHEPFDSRDIKDDTKTIIKQKTNPSKLIIEEPVRNTSPQAFTRSQDVVVDDNYPKQYRTIKKEHKLTRASLKLQPAPDGTVGNLSQQELTAYLAVMGQRESSNDYQAVNRLGYLGKYQMGTFAMKEAGLVPLNDPKSNSNRVLLDPNNWVGKLGKQGFLNNPDIQEKAMLAYTQAHYEDLSKKGYIDDTTTNADVGRLLAAAHLVGPSMLRVTKDSSGKVLSVGTEDDDNGVTAESYGDMAYAALLSVSPTITA